MKKHSKTNFENSPVYWFVILDHAASTGNFALAAEAQDRLANLGVDVQYKKRPGQLTLPANCREVSHAK